MLYARPQIRLLVALGATLLVGIGVREWRAGFPDLAERVERFDWSGDAAPTPQVRTGAGPPQAREGADRGAAREEDGDIAGARADRRPAGPLDLNVAGADELARLPGVGASLARRIVEERERSGGFESPEGLRRVYGLGPRKLAVLRGLVVASGAGGAQPPPAEPVPLAPPPDGAASGMVPAPDARDDDPPSAEADRHGMAQADRHGTADPDDGGFDGDRGKDSSD